MRQLIVTGTPDGGDGRAVPEPGTVALVALGLFGLSPRERAMRGGALVGARRATAPGTALRKRASTTQIKVLSNRADLISGGDALVEVVPAPPPGR